LSWRKTIQNNLQKLKTPHLIENILNRFSRLLVIIKKHVHFFTD
jgi:hypothetical protein